MNIYKQMLETIIEEMNGILAKGDTHSVVDSEYGQWMNFLRQIHPDSHLLKNQGALSDTNFSKEMRRFTAILEVIELAAAEHYPNWHIQPKFSEYAVLEYEQGALKAEQRDMGVSQAVEGFTGRIRGALTSEQQFIATDVDKEMDFLKKMGFLEHAGFTVAEFIHFPTAKIRDTSVGNLQTHIHNYISKAQEKGLNVDGAIIVSDTPIGAADKKFSSTRVAYVPPLITLN